MGYVQLFLVDAFTSVPFAGNPAGVCLTESDDAVWMQAVAAEVNVSETAFVDVSTLATTGEVGLRWFTPTVEVEIADTPPWPAPTCCSRTSWRSPISFRTAVGVLRAEKLPGGGIQLDFPIDEPVSALPDGALADEFADALGASVIGLSRCRDHVLVEIPSVEEVRTIEPDLSALRAASGRGVIVTARAENGGAPGADFVSRFFAPAVGIDEDPVTGSAHCCLAPYWAERLGRERLVGAQLSARGGEVGVELAGDRVLLRGDAVVVTRGQLVGDASKL